jgi:tetratricopeptide (TPR) repeat protein
MHVNSLRLTNNKLKEMYYGLLDEKISVEEFWKVLLPFMKKLREGSNVIGVQKAKIYGLQLTNLAEKVAAYRSSSDIENTSEAIVMKKEILEVSWNFLMSVGEALAGMSNIVQPSLYGEKEDEEIKKLIKRIEEDPNNSEVYNALGNYYFYKKRYDEAIDQYNEAITKDPKPVYYANIGDAYREKGSFTESGFWYEKALRLDPDDDINNDKLGQIYLLKGQFDNAIESFMKALSKRSNPFYLIDLGDAYMQKKEWDTAIDYYQEAIAINPEDSGAHNAMANAYVYKYRSSNVQDKDLLDKSLNHFHKSVEINKDDALAYAGLGDIYLHLGDWKEAIENYKNVMKRSPKDISSINNMGYAYLKMQDYGKALECFNQAFTINPKNSLSLKYMGDYFSQLGKYDDAINYYQKSLDIDPRDAATSYSLGIAYIVKGQPDLALRFFIDATTIDPENFLYQSELGLLYTRLNPPQWDNARVALKKAIELNSNDDLSYLGLGDVLLGMGLFTQALENYQKALSLNPENPEHSAALSTAYSRLRMWDEALRYAKMANQKAKEKDSSNDRYTHYIGLVYHDMGLFYFDQKQYEDAINEFKEATKYKEFETTYYSLYLSYYELNKFNDAKQCLTKAVELFKKKYNKDNEKYLEALQDSKLS